MELIYLFVVLISISLNNARQFCSPPTENIASPSELPSLPKEFETRLVMSSQDDNTTTDAIILYDSFRKKGELVVYMNGLEFRRVYYFEEDEILNIKDGQTCEVTKLSSSMDPFFGSQLIQSASQFFHFNNGFLIENKGQETRRGILVNHFQSCQNWTDLYANYIIDFYFQVPQFSPSIQQDYKDILVEIAIEGYMSDDKFKRTYSFYDFRSLIENRLDLFTQPAGVFCVGQTFKKPVPIIPKYFSFSSEIINNNQHYAFSTKSYYSQELNAYRIDLPKYENDEFGIYDTTPVKIIHDYNSGAGYIINKEIGNCSFYTLNPETAESLESNIVYSNFGSFMELKPPNQLFDLDEKAFYAGQRYERGILCDVYVVNRTDVKIPGIETDYFVYEVYIMSKSKTADNLDVNIPISTHLTVPNSDFSIMSNIYNFDTKLDRRRFDVSKCFSGKKLKSFAVKYDYPKNMDKETFDSTYGARLIEIFDQTLLSTFKIFNSSPLRILETKLESNENGFIVYSGVHDFAPAIYHFKKYGYSKIDINKAQRAIDSSSAENCAKICLNESVYDVFNYKCLSFDICPKGDNYICSFYNQSLITDPAIESANESVPLCSHYSKIVSKVDGVDVETLFRSVKESMAKKLLDLEITDQKTIVFPSVDLFEYENLNAESGTTGSTSFFQKFKLHQYEYDFNETIIANQSGLFIRKKSGVSIDECSRLCLNEISFSCQTMSYLVLLSECKWSSLDSDDYDDYKNSTYFYPQSNCKLFYRDVLYNYVEYPYKVTTNTDYIVVEDVSTPSVCARRCNKEKTINCRSFNLCKVDKTNSFNCLLSSTNIHRNLNVTNANTCTHYSKYSLYDFQLVPSIELQISAKSIFYEVTVEECAELCVYEDSYLCRSFDYKLDKKCFLFSENIKDEIFVDLKKTENPNSNHYSRLYYEKDGVVVNIGPVGAPFKAKYNSGTIFGTVFGLTLAFFVMGVLFGFVYLKLTTKPKSTAVMKYKNPNYKENS